MIFLEKPSETTLQSATSRRARSLRASMGVRSTCGWCEVEGCPIAWEESSADKDAQPVLCLHTAGTGSREFRPLLDCCPAGSRLILLDWPGHGRSGDTTREDSETAPAFTVESCSAILSSLLNQLGIGRPILLGSGFGAAVAIRYASDHPDQVLGLVLCLPAGLVSTSGVDPFSQSGKRGIGRLLRRMKKSAPGNTAKETAIAARRQALRMEALHPAMQSIRAIAKDSADRTSTSLRKALDSLSCPAFFALSHGSREYPLRKYLALLDPSLAWAPQHQFTVFAGAFHPLWDEPERFALALSSFVQAQLPVERHTHAWMIHAVDWPVKDNNLWKCVHPDCATEQVLAAGLNANERASGIQHRQD